MLDIDEVEKLKTELHDLLGKIKAAQKVAADKTIPAICEDVADVPKVPLKPKRNLRGHISKVSSIHFAADSRHLLSGALDGKLIIWDTWTGNKIRIISLRSSWVMMMSVSYAKFGNFVSCGGMDNMCTVYNLNSTEGGIPKNRWELAGLEGFLSCSCFLDDNVVITGSADMKMYILMDFGYPCVHKF